MATDARFDKIQKIVPCKNSDNLETVIVSNFPCVVRKGEFKEGEYCFYIRDDAKLIGWDELKSREERNREAQKTGALVTQDCFTCTHQWQDNLLKYLGNGGRVKTIKLRGNISMGIILKPIDVLPIGFKEKEIDDVLISCLNNKINNPGTGAKYLEEMFGIVHWEQPTTSVGCLDVKFCGLPENLEISDQENFENIEECDLHLGERALITKKLDGSSTTIVCRPDGTYDVSSRRMTFKEENDPSKMNAYIKYAQDAIKGGLWYAKTFNRIIAIRGETCCRAFNKSSFNKDCELNGFFVYATEFPEEENYFLKHGIYGKENHFTEIIKRINTNGFGINMVPVLGEETITKELLESYVNKGYTFGEGIVVNVKCEDINNINSLVWSYKAKSREYLMKMK